MCKIMETQNENPNNLAIYKKHAQPPDWALKAIQAGRLKGKTDINPQWRIEALTEIFGICGFGWKYTIDESKIVEGASGEKVAFVNISLYVKLNGEWSDAIIGTGGSSFIANESKGLYTSDECFKMATTDAISVACKQLGIAANIYSGSKYDVNKIQTPPPNQGNKPENSAASADKKPLMSEDQKNILIKQASQKHVFNNQESSVILQWILQPRTAEAAQKYIDRNIALIKEREDILHEQANS